MDLKKLIKKLLFPPIWLTGILAVISTVSLIYVFMGGMAESPAAYAVFTVSFYTFAVICIFIAEALPKRYKNAKQKLYQNPFTHRYMTDLQFKNRVSLCRSLTINLIYVGTNIFSAVFYRSVWFAILAAYYTVLSIMRFLLIRYLSKNRLGENRLTELRRSILCAVILTTLNIILSGAVLMILHRNKGFSYNSIMIYVMAIYSFCITASAVIDLIRYRKYDNPVLSTSKVIKMAAALVSLLSLETAMLSQFGEKMSPENQRILIAATGACISTVIIIMSVSIIVGSAKEIKEMRCKKNGE